MARNFEARNHGFGTRDMGKAGKQSFIESKNSFSSVRTKSDRFNKFSKWAKEQHGIKDLRDVTKDIVRDYADHLVERHENGELSPRTMHNDLSAVNTAMTQAKGDKSCFASGKDAGFPSKSGIAKESRCISEEKHNEVKSQVTERLGSQMEMQRQFGLRFKESCLINAKDSLQSALENGFITVDRGTKGGQSREVPITNDKQIQALEEAAKIQGNHTSMIPQEQSFNSYQSECYEQIRDSGLGGFHGERHSYANDRYEELTGNQSPIESLKSKSSESTASDLDLSCPEPEKDSNPFQKKALPSGDATIDEGEGCWGGHSTEKLKSLSDPLLGKANEMMDLMLDMTRKTPLSDKDARQKISEELGHHRLDITKAYLG